MRITAPKKIVISRTDSIGDVALTLPVIGILRQKYPKVIIVFLCNTYTKPIVDTVDGVDEIWSWAELQEMGDGKQLAWLKSQNVDVFIHVFPRREIARLVRKANIPHRIGTSHRLFHILTCNHRINFTRKNSPLHEAQLNTKLLKPLGIDKVYPLSDLNSFVKCTNTAKLEDEFSALLQKNKTNIIFHPKSKGSALEWGVNNFIALAKALPLDKFQIFFTGTEDEAIYFRNELPSQSNIIDLSGKMTLAQLISFIDKADTLVAGSTGPLHIAGLTNINAVGLYTSRRPLHPGRWQPLGKHVHIIVEETESDRHQTLNISLRRVLDKISELV